MKREKITCIIPARYESSRFPGKPLSLIAGKTLLQRTYERVNLCSIFDNIYIATDDNRIKDHASAFNANVIMTNINCLNGTERIIQALNTLEDIDDNDIIVNVQGDHPLISTDTILSTIESLKHDNTAVMSTAATYLKNKDEIISPHNVKVIFDKNNTAIYFSRSPIPFSKNLDKTNFYYHIGIYAYRSNFLKKLATLPPTENQISEDLEQLKVLEHGYKIKVALVDEKPLGVDIPQDINKIERVLCP